MARNEFGKIVFIARDNLTEGFLLRKTNTGVILENYLNPEHTNVEVVAEFEGANFGYHADFDKLFTEARKYVVDLKVPINVDLNRATTCA